MSMTIGGSNGITFPNGSGVSSGNVSSLYSPFIKDTTNVMTVNNGVKFSGTNGLIIRNVTYPIGYTIYLTISSNTTNYNVQSAAITAGWNQSSAIGVFVTINTGVVVGSSSTGSYALDTGTFPAGSSVAIINNGRILGAGGVGGSGAIGALVNGGAGGPAIRAQIATIVQNNGIIGGGGGGGGEANGYQTGSGKAITTYYGGGGGGGQGSVGGAGGTAQGPGAANGGAGTPDAPGVAGGSQSGDPYAAGAGGSLGSSGANGQGWGGNVFGAGGAALVGLSFVNSGSGLTGTVYGGQS